ncbi:helix-turn-helix transcriptional regulator [bacterium]|nr:helix-turn-helix transcriptional regulator [bacterium]
MSESLSLAQFVSERRENIGLSQTGLSKKCNIPIKMIEDIECGNELFLATSVRQKLAKGLKVEPSEIKKYEKTFDVSLVSDAKYIDDIKIKILAGEGEECVCPVCGEKLVTRIAQMYDLEDVLQLHPKAHCTKCPFQIR